MCKSASRGEAILPQIDGPVNQSESARFEACKDATETTSFWMALSDTSGEVRCLTKQGCAIVTARFTETESFIGRFQLRGPCFIASYCYGTWRSLDDGVGPWFDRTPLRSVSVHRRIPPGSNSPFP